MFRIIFLTLVSKAVAESHFSQGHIKYKDASGTNVDWKLYAPYSQFKSQLHHYQRRNSAKSPPDQSPIIQPAQNPVGVEGKNSEPRYKPFSQVPNHLKQLLTQSYEPQLPYVDHDAFFHRIPQFSFGEVAPPKSQTMDYQSETQSTIIRPQDQRELRKQNFGEKEEAVQQERSQAQVPLMADSPQPLAFDKSVPLEIQQLLHYQAQIPYNVIANHIIYKPKIPFVPEPLPEDEVGPYQYRSKVYYAVQGSMRSNKNQHPGTEERNEE